MPVPQIEVLTLFPRQLGSTLGPDSGLVGRALADGVVALRLHDLRAFGHGPHQQVDDAPYGGGAGMVLMPDVLVPAIEQVDRSGTPPAHVILLTPQGAPLTQATVRRLAALPRLLLVCGRYEGFDERIRDFAHEELSLGDFVLSGGELAAAALIDAMVRLRPGVLGNAASLAEESHGGRLEYPHYTRPEEFRGLRVPEVLRSGHHARITAWRRRQALLRTLARRPDLLAGVALDAAELALLAQPPDQA